MGFNDAQLFAQHMNSLHPLPVFGPEYQPKEATAETAFNGVLQTYEIVNNTADRDLESFLLNKGSAIATLIEQQLSQGPQKESTIGGESTVIKAAPRWKLNRNEGAN